MACFRRIVRVTVWFHHEPLIHMRPALIQCKMYFILSDGSPGWEIWEITDRSLAGSNPLDRMGTAEA
jgi:hypothetical protein